MMKTKLTAIRLTIEALAVLLVAVYLVANYEARITAVNWRLVSIIMIAAMAIFAVYRWQTTEGNGYDVLEMLKSNGRADLNAHFQVIFAGLSVWLVVQQAVTKQPVAELMLGVLGIFVAGKAAKGFSDAIQNRAAPVDQSQNVNVLPNATVQPASDPPDLEAAGRGVVPPKRKKR